jgi:hypothetical protein
MTRAEFRAKFPTQYNWLIRNNPELLNEKLPQIKSDRKPAGFWTKAECMKSASKFTILAAWTEACPGAEDSARKNGWLKECIAHMVVILGKWTKEACR